ncbi:nuclear transport factor 2 family protein [Flavobacterium sp. P21]|uniref:nuclear transport factor 2 family protein n=1 Tax=Flavobacterium sp. P21 TaxID=3423948 RepID=UPI003D664B68
MKTILVTAFILFFVQGIDAQSTKKMENNQNDMGAIRVALEQNYFEGIYQGNVDLLKQIFYPDTLLFGDVNGVPYSKTLVQYLDGVANRQSPKDSGKPFKGEIITIKVVNSIAIAEVKVKMYDFYYHDLLSFHRIDGHWFIVNKMLTNSNE